MMVKMMVEFAPFGAEYMDYVVEIVGSCIFPIKICADLTFFHRKNMQTMHKIRVSICRKRHKSDYI